MNKNSWLGLILFFSTAVLADGRIALTSRPPNFETPVAQLYSEFTPNDLFFVRYHLGAIPKVDPKTWKLTLFGMGFSKPVSFTLEQLKTQFEWVEVPALAYCAGNQRALFKERVPGVQWTYGAMGNAAWRGVRLKDLLQKAGLQKDAVEVVFDGADAPVLPKTPDFIKSIPVSKAMDSSTLVALEMNGEPLPHLQGYPARLVVPGWAATYWMKHLISIEAVTKPDQGFWMKAAYRIPRGKFDTKDHFKTQETPEAEPITDLVVNSVMTNVTEGLVLKKGTPFVVQGVAWDGGTGVATVQLSLDQGKTWRDATLGRNIGRYAWRLFSFRLDTRTPGPRTLMVQAKSRDDRMQVAAEIPNGAGYHRNPVQKLTVRIE